MDDLAAHCCGHGKGSAVDDCSGRSGGDGAYVADVAADCVKQACASLRIGSGRQRGITRRGLGGAHETGKVVNVRQTVGVIMVFRIGYRVAQGGAFRWLQAAGHTLLVYVGIGRERQQAGLLVLPAEPAATNCAPSFRNRNLDELSCNLAAALAGLVLGNGKQRITVNGFNKAIAQSVGGGTQRIHVFASRHAL